MSILLYQEFVIPRDYGTLIDESVLLLQTLIQDKLQNKMIPEYPSHIKYRGVILVISIVWIY